MAPAARNQTGAAPQNNNVPFSHADGRGQNQPSGGQHRPQQREQTSAAPRGQQSDTNPNFPARRQQHAYFNEGYSRRYSPPTTFPSPGFNNTMASGTVGRSIIQLVENQSHSLDFILVGQQSQMDAYREMTHSNQARARCSICRN